MVSTSEALFEKGIYYWHAVCASNYLQLAQNRKPKDLSFM